jgi:excisionase family DNA binding protein
MSNAQNSDGPAERINLPDLSDDRLWKVRDVCRYLQKGRTWIYSEVAAERIPFLRIGGELRFDPADIKAWARGELPAAKVVPLNGRNR